MCCVCKSSESYVGDRVVWYVHKHHEKKRRRCLLAKRAIIMMNRSPMTMISSPPQRTPGGSSSIHRSASQTPSTIDREQAMRDYKLTLEYKNLSQHSPGGVYLVPSYDDNRFFHGVIFVRRGLFTNGIFKFTLHCPIHYNEMGAHPQVKFTSYVYNPHVHPDTGELDVKCAFPEWNPSKHFLITVMTYLKRIFYIKDYKDMSVEEQSSIPNQEALQLFHSDPDGYRRRVQVCVEESQRSVYLNDPGGTMNFTKDEYCHEVLRSLFKERFGESMLCSTTPSNDDAGESKGEDGACAVIATREDVLEMVQQAMQHSAEERF